MIQLSKDKRKATYDEVAFQNSINAIGKSTMTNKLTHGLIMTNKPNIVKTITDILDQFNMPAQEKYINAKYMLECYQTYSLFPCENRLYERASAVFYAYFVEQGEE